MWYNLAQREKGWNMKNFTKPVFTQAELDEMNGHDLYIGYRPAEIPSGYDFEKKPFASERAKKLITVKEKLNGTEKKRHYHEKINSFGWARTRGNDLVFGIKFSSSNPKGLSKTGSSVIKKFKQLLGYYLEQVGWQDITLDDRDDYVIPLTNPANIKLLYTLSPSIGFYYKSTPPDLEMLRSLEFKCQMNQQRQKNFEKSL